MTHHDGDSFFLEHILTWFSQYGREFPWRKFDITPFQSLVTELLLQRTKASMVADIHGMFMEKYGKPSLILEAGKSKLQDDLQPLGMHKRRAHSLHTIAMQIKEEHGGKVPEQEQVLLKLPGIGRYIARAVQCFAFGMPVSIVDVNVTRILCRFYSLENKGDNRRNKHLWKKAQAIINREPARAKEINWAMLDLAATVCISRTPQCNDCPLLDGCRYIPLRKSG
ncbi:hypothetical protein GF325_18585 [Candidatus Bathyarchaeota archaeon]|nr:hypothetical protein [Candidatus Bathyarchaeota archaeon]